jgi:hypothetical protein
VTTALLLSALMVLPAQADDPEPHGNKGIVVRLVAKKSTYKLDFGGKKKDDYVAAARKGTAAAVPVEMEFVIANYTKREIRVRLNDSASWLALELRGAEAIEAESASTTARPKLSEKILKHGQKWRIPIPALASASPGKVKGKGERNHDWTEPGEYTLGVSLTAVVDLDHGKKFQASHTLTLTAKAITLKVEK